MVGAALSLRQKMRQAYESGDPYLAFGKMAGALPADATKETHPRIRAVQNLRARHPVRHAVDRAGARARHDRR